METENTTTGGSPVERTVRPHCPAECSAQEREDCDALRFRMAELLTKTVNAVRGEPQPRYVHSWHDVPELVQRAMAALREANELCRSAHEIAKREGQDTNWTAFRARLLESCLRQAAAIHQHEVRADSAVATAKVFKMPR